MTFLTRKYVNNKKFNKQTQNLLLILCNVGIFHFRTPLLIHINFPVSLSRDSSRDRCLFGPVSRNNHMGVIFPRLIHAFLKLVFIFVNKQSALKIGINFKHETNISDHVFKFFDSIYFLQNICVKLS
jgi:hypothetical protein